MGFGIFYPSIKVRVGILGIQILRWVGKQKDLYNRQGALVKEFSKRGYLHYTPLDKRFATGSGDQTIFINTMAEQKVILKKPCECLLHI